MAAVYDIEELATSLVTPSPNLVLPPLMVAPGPTAITARVGQFVSFQWTDPNRTLIATNRPELLELFQGHRSGAAMFNPGAKALGPGEALVKIEGADGSTWRVYITIIEG